jgi:membrane protein YdbS with pleckstrin-like domain
VSANSMEPPLSASRQVEHLQPSALLIVGRLLASIFILDTFYVVLLAGFFALNNLHDWHESYVLVLVVAHTLKYVLISSVVIELFARWAGRAYYITESHLIQRTGLVNITETTFELSQLKSVVMRQGWLGRRFNFGTITLTFTFAAYGEQQGGITLSEITNPNRYKQYFDQYLRSAVITHHKTT